MISPALLNIFPLMRRCPLNVPIALKNSLSVQLPCVIFSTTANMLLLTTCCCEMGLFLKGIFARKKDELIEVHMKPKTLSSIWYSKIGVTWTSGRQFFVLMFLHVMLLEWKLFPVCLNVHVLLRRGILVWQMLYLLRKHCQQPNWNAYTMPSSAATKPLRCESFGNCFSEMIQLYTKIISTKILRKYGFSRHAAFFDYISKCFCND